MIRILVVLFLFFLPQFSFGQSPMLTQPYGVKSTIASPLTVTTTGTFQTLWTTSTNNRGRAGCIVQNQSTHTQYVYFGTPATALSANAIQLAAGQSLTCTAGGIVAQDTVSITGTSGDAFYAAQQ